MAMEIPRSLPQYPEMIFGAISALSEATGSNKSSISNYIESTYGDLPAGHSELLTQHLEKLKASGELVFVKNNYMRPNPDAPPKRGRGRPPKPKSAAAMALAAAKSAHVGPPRGRGRPPKNKDGSAGGGSVVEKRKVSEPSVRPRGRPKKVKADEGGEDEGGDDEEEGGDHDEVVPAGVPGDAGVNITASPKPRGRPPKGTTPFGSVGF